MDIQLEREYAIDNMGDSIGQAIEKATDEDRLEDASIVSSGVFTDNIAESKLPVRILECIVPEGYSNATNQSQ